MMWKLTSILCGFGILIGCMTTPGGPEKVGLPSEELLSGAALGFSEVSSSSSFDDEVLALSPGMREFLDEHVDRTEGPNTRLQQLIDAIIRDGTFGLKADERTRTATETFAARRGNCLSFSNMFVAMARDIGLQAHFQEVDVPPDWTFDHETYVLNLHVNVLLDLGAAGTPVVDFNIADFRSTYDRRVISDARALAHYFNNLGVEHLQGGDTVGAFACFRKSLKDCDPSFSPAWSNLGILYRRNKLLDYAEAAYLQALVIDSLDPVAMSNLAALHAYRGDHELAQQYRKKILHHREQNPYFRYHRAQEAFRAGEYRAAESDLRYAIRKRPLEDQFMFLLSVVYYKKGNLAAARTWMERAELAAATETLKRKYARKMDALMTSETGN